MPSFKCIHCDRNYNEGQSSRKVLLGYCQTCKNSLVQQGEQLDDLGEYVKMANCNISIHDIALQDLEESVKVLPQLGEDLSEANDKVAIQGKAIHDLEQQMVDVEESVKYILPQVKQGLAKMEDKIEAKAETQRLQFQFELEKLKYDMEALRFQRSQGEEQFRLDLAKIEAETTKEKCKAEVEIAKAQAEIAQAQVSEKKELNKAFDRMNKSKSPAVALAIFNSISSANSSRTNSVMAEDEYTSLDDYTSYGNNPHEVDSPAQHVSDKWTHLHKSAPLRYNVGRK